MTITNELRKQAEFYEECYERGFYKARGHHSRRGESKAYFAKVKNSERIFIFPGSLLSMMKNNPEIEEIREF